MGFIHLKTALSVTGVYSHLETEVFNEGPCPTPPYIVAIARIQGIHNRGRSFLIFFLH